MKSITSEHIAAYLRCPRKAFLMLNSSETYQLTNYETLLQSFQNQAFEEYLQKSPDIQGYNNGILKKGFEVIRHCRQHIEGFEFESPILVKNEGKSALGKFYYEPALFLGTNLISKENRLELAFLGYLLEKIQNKFPEKGVIIDKSGGKHRVELSKLKKQIKAVVAEIQDFEANPPKLLLNKHCSQCSFETFCKTQAQKEDNLSLLDRITIKQISKLEKKGIFTVKQLSFIYKPRRRNKRVKNPPISYKPELQALAIRTEKTYIQRLPSIDRKPVELFLDMEGLPDDSFYYLFGVLVVENEKSKHYSFWVDSPKDESENWQKVVHLIDSYPESPIYHYGTFEPSAFEKLAKKHQTNIESIKKRFVNINSFIYGKIYFPTYSNGLKDLGKSLGVKWTDEKASGLQTISWRNEWERGQTKRKDDLLNYNQEDCLALKILTDELTRIQTTATVSNDVEFVQNPKKIASEISQGVHNQFKNILELAHNNANKSKISFDKEVVERVKQKRIGVTFSPPKITKKVFINHPEFCPQHPETKLSTTQTTSIRIIVDIVFTENGVRKSVVKYEGFRGYCELCHKMHFHSFYLERSKIYGHNFKAWLIYQRVSLQLPYSKIGECLESIFGKKMSCEGNYSNFIKNLGCFYQETEDNIVKKLLDSPFVHADETSINIRGENQYVWVFTNDKYVILRLSKNRESNLADEFLKNYKGVLVTDFYAGYDNIDCPQQKCWVHFIRDLNNDLWDNPFDKEYECFVSEVRNLIVPIIQTVHKHGLKKHFLSKYKKYIDRFYKSHIDDKTYKSELCSLYQKRFIRHRNHLFTFLDHDNVNWHNNSAERALRHICTQRKISGTLFESTTLYYLRLVSIMQTCRFQNKSFLEFLLSKEKDIDNFGVRKKKVAESEQASGQ
ncbi:IS66 family transposase [Runella sp.]|jgi:predicted RecB family nuclease|uniref:IS66 family transposase n=1 Tax=Runella sp. TaxID=1960881 RepID=UPI00262FD36D|nr:IS66 family transposase [Runella sp.]